MKLLLFFLAALAVLHSGTAQAQCRRDIVFLLDDSASNILWTSFRQFVSALADNLGMTRTADTRIGVILFNERARIALPLQGWSQYVPISIEALQLHGGLTNMTAGLEAAHQMLTRSVNPNDVFGNRAQQHVIVFSDGMVNQSPNLERIYAERMRFEGINIIAYGLGSNINRQTLYNIVGPSRTNQVLVEPTFFQDFSQVRTLVSLTDCQFNTPMPPDRCEDTSPADIILALDSSGSIKDDGEDGWRNLKQLAERVISTLATRRPGSRFGAVMFSDFGEEVSPLNSDYQRVMFDIDRARHLDGFTNHADGLQRVRNLFQSGGTMSRKRYMVMITDGKSTKDQRMIPEKVQALAGDSVTRIVIGYSRDVDDNTLNAIATSPSNSHVFLFRDRSFSASNVNIDTIVRLVMMCPMGQAIISPPDECYTDIVFAVDDSGSINDKGRQNFNSMRDFVAGLARNIYESYRNQGIRLALLRFSKDAIIESYLRDFRDIDSFLGRVRNMQYQGYTTNITAGIVAARRIIQEDGSRNRAQIILITDGYSNVGKFNEFQEAANTRNFGIRIIPIGVTYEIERRTLEQLAGGSNNVFTSPSFHALQSQIIGVSSSTCGPEPTPEPCTGEPEIVFALDTSASISDSDFMRAKQFVISAVEGFYRSNMNTRFGLVLFSTNARRAFGLTDFSRSLVDQIRTVQPDLKTTNIAGAIELATAEVLRSPRRSSNRVIILITDGEPKMRIGEERAMADIAKRQGITIVGVSVGLFGNQFYRLIEDIATTPQHALRSANFLMLEQRLNTLMVFACRPGAVPQPPRVFTTRPPFRPSPRIFAPFPPFGQPARQQCEQTAVIFAVDVSSSAMNDFVRTKGLVNQLASDIYTAKSNIQLALVAYDGHGSLVQPFTNRLDVFQSSVQRLLKGDTRSSLVRGVFFSRSQFNMQSNQNYMIIVGGGYTNVRDDMGREQGEREVLQSTGITALAIVPDPRVYTEVYRLEAVTNRVYRASNYALSSGQVNEIVNRVINPNCNFARNLG